MRINENQYPNWAKKNWGFVKAAIEGQFPGIVVDVSPADGVNWHGQNRQPGYIEITLPDGVNLHDVRAFLETIKISETEEEAKAEEVFQLLVTYRLQELKDALQ